MTEWFDDLSRAMAGGITRRGILKTMGAAFGAAAAASALRPFRADARTSCSGPTTVGASPCQAGTTGCGPCCCKAGVACRDSSTGKCGCPPGGAVCGPDCCLKGETCSDAATGTCCPKGQTPCGLTCCRSGVGCLGAGKGVCGDGCGGTPPGGSWTPFNKCPSPAVGSTLTTFSVTGPKTLWVTDFGSVGDQFEVFDGATSLGRTSPVPNVCNPVDSKYEPNAAWLDPRYSKRTYCLGPGNHTIKITVAQAPCDCIGFFYKFA